MLPNSQSNETAVASEWDTYVNNQIRDKWPDLSFQKRHFGNEYLKNGYNHREAALSCGRIANAGIRLISEPLIREYILYLEAQRTSRSIISERFLEAQYMELLSQANGEVEVPLVTGAGEKITAQKFNGSLKLAVLQELGKVSGVTKPDAQETGKVTVVIDIGKLTGTDHSIVADQ